MNTNPVIDYLLKDAESITQRAVDQGRGLTDHEKATVQRNLARVTEIKDNERLAETVLGMNSPSSGGHSSKAPPVARSAGSVGRCSPPGSTSSTTPR